MNSTKQVIIEKSFETIANHIKADGLRVEDHFRVSDQGIALTHKAAKAMKKTGFPHKIPSNKSLKGLGLPRDGSFFHPLSEAESEEDSGVEGGLANLWLSASIFVNFAMGWEPSDDSSKSITLVKGCVSKANPMISVDRLMEAARYSDPKLLKLVSLTKEGLDISFAKAFNR